MSGPAHHHLEAVPKATDLFWEKGFHATSMRNLQQATSLRPGSIYASFGSKEALFRLSLNHYSKRSREMLHRQVAECHDPAEGLKQFIIHVLLCQSDAPSSMCMLVKTISELTEEHAELLAEAKRLLNGMEDEFATVIRLAQELGTIDSDRDAARMAQRLQVQFMGLRAYIKAHGGGCQTIELVNDIFENL